MKNIKNNIPQEITEEAKEALRNRVFDSIRRYRLRKKISYWSAAAVVLMLLSGSGMMYFKMNSLDNSYASYLDTMKIDSINKVSVVTSEETLTLNEEDSIVTYSANTIKIGKKLITNDKSTALNTVIVPYGKRTQLTLSDGTKVWLNAGSKLVYPVSFTNSKRKVYLIGEAVFDVAHDKVHSFIVHTKNQEIEVLGTVFNISAYADEPEIKTALKQGSVKLHYIQDGLIPVKKSVTIAPGMVASLDKSNMAMRTTTENVGNYFLWKDGLIVFHKNTFPYILKRLSRYYNVSIELDNKNLENETFSGYLDLKESLTDVLTIISESTSFSQREENNTIIIK